MIAPFLGQWKFDSLFLTHNSEKMIWGGGYYYSHACYKRFKDIQKEVWKSEEGLGCINYDLL